MKKRLIYSLPAMLLFLVFFLDCTFFKDTDRISVGKFNHGGAVILVKTNGEWGISINNGNNSSAIQDKPVFLEVYLDSLEIISIESGYQEVKKKRKGFTGNTVVEFNDVSFDVSDHWTIDDNILRLDRELKVIGDIQKAGFLSSIRFENQDMTGRNEVDYFAPGMIYGPPDHITELAIGGRKSGLITWIREDRLPAPMFGIRYLDGSSVTIMNSLPDGSTTKEDSRDLQVIDLIDERFRFGAIGAMESEGNLSYGYVWPGTEGSYTYRGRTYPGGQIDRWRRRYHPVQDGLVQQYQVSFRFEKDAKTFPEYYKAAWRWAWDVLDPQVNPQDIEAARRSLVDMLGERVMTIDGFSGIPYFMTAAITPNPHINMKTAMGFVGKALESVNYLLQDADRGQSPNDEKHRELAIDIVRSFMEKLTLNPPNGEGFMMDTGEPVMVRPQDGKMYLRSFGDDLKALLKAVKREKEQGRMHEDWLGWAKSFGDWLLPQQQEAGGFPRGWEQGTGKIVDDSPNASYAVIPYLVLLSELTEDPVYLEAAIKAADFCWNSTQNRGLFVGGTIDNPDVIDKEAGTLSAEAYLAIYEVDPQQMWIDRAQAAADFAETWIYIWDIPMPIDEKDEDLPWKKGVSTVGMQLISTGHSLSDVYMTFDVDEYAKLYKLTGDRHYYDVAKILLHNTKGMLAIPGREYDLRGPGWQQEHWSMAPMRGFGFHRGWLPWVSTSHLNGIFGLEEYDKDLFEELSLLQ
jgi:hypothetical protein